VCVPCWARRPTRAGIDLPLSKSVRTSWHIQPSHTGCVAGWELVHCSGHALRRYLTRTVGATAHVHLGTECVHSGFSHARVLWIFCDGVDRTTRLVWRLSVRPAEIASTRQLRPAAYLSELPDDSSLSLSLLNSPWLTQPLLTERLFSPQQESEPRRTHLKEPPPPPDQNELPKSATSPRAHESKRD
jgi:hypothetical protein